MEITYAKQNRHTVTSMDSGFTLHDLFSPLTTKKSFWIIVTVGTLVYFNMLFNGFVWDDLTYIIGNQELEGFRLKQLIGQNMFNSSGYFRPIPAIYFSLLYNLFGQIYFFYHLFQLVLHLTSTTILNHLYKKFFSAKVALILSLVFLVHPINVESVSYIGSTQSQLYFIFGGLALLYSFKDRLSFKRSLIIHIFFVLALLTKEVSILYLFLIYFYRLVYRLQLPRTFPLLTVFTLGGYLALRLSVLDTFLHRMEMIPISELSLPDRLLHIPAVFFYYLHTFFYPRVLAINQIWTFTSINFSNFFLPLLGGITFMSSITIFGFRQFIKSKSDFRAFLFFLGWFVSGIVFLLQIFPLDMTVADRWFYFPIVGLLAILGIMVSHVQPLSSPKWQTVAIWIFVATLSALSIRTIIRNADWHDALTLYRSDADKYDNYDLQNNLGAELAFTGDFAAALPHFLESVRLLPHDTNLYNTATAYEKLGNYPQAISYYQQALQIRTNFPGHSQVIELSTVSLARLLLLHGEPNGANELIVNSIKSYPQNGSLWAFYAINLYNQNKQDEAVSAANRAVELMPNPSTLKLQTLITNRQKLDLRLE